LVPGCPGYELRIKTSGGISLKDAKENKMQRIFELKYVYRIGAIQ
jgi:hypothetical protein